VPFAAESNGQAASLSGMGGKPIGYINVIAEFTKRKTMTNDPTGSRSSILRDAQALHSEITVSLASYLTVWRIS
jgi:hypothetical protein